MNPQTKAELMGILFRLVKLYSPHVSLADHDDSYQLNKSLSALEKVIDAEVVRELEKVEEVGHGSGNWRRILFLAIAARKEKQ